MSGEFVLHHLFVSDQLFHCHLVIHLVWGREWGGWREEGRDREKEKERGMTSEKGGGILKGGPIAL